VKKFNLKSAALGGLGTMTYFFEVRKMSQESAQYGSNDEGDDGSPAWPRSGQACVGTYECAIVKSLQFTTIGKPNSTLNASCESLSCNEQYTETSFTVYG